MSEGTDISNLEQAPSVTEPGATASGAATARQPFDWNAIVASPAFIPGVLITFGIIALYWSMMKFLPGLWLGDDGYYSHGLLVPLISGYIVYRNWDKLKTRPVQPSYFALIPLGLMMLTAYINAATNIYFLASIGLALTLLSATWFIAGWQWMKGLFWPIMYLLWALPVFQVFIDNFTNPLQLLSTKVAFHLLSAFGLEPYMDDPTTINLAKFTLNIAVACSGMKLLVALGAFTMFFMLVANFRLYANIVMVALWVPLALFINGLRIALIGVVGNTWGHAAGMKFHDYSGYLVLVLCFFILFKVARGLGWKD